MWNNRAEGTVIHSEVILWRTWESHKLHGSTKIKCNTIHYSFRELKNGQSFVTLLTSTKPPFSNYCLQGQSIFPGGFGLCAMDEASAVDYLETSQTNKRLSAAQDRKALQRLIKTAKNITGTIYRASVASVKSAQSPKDCRRQHPPSHSLFTLLPSDKIYSSTRLQSSFFPLRLLNVFSTLRHE